MTEFNICICLTKSMDSLVAAIIPWLVFYPRNHKHNKILLLIVPWVIMSLLSSIIEVLLYPVDYVLTLSLQIVSGLISAQLLYEGLFSLKFLIQSTITCTTLLLHFIISGALANHYEKMMQYTWPHTIIVFLSFPLLAYYLYRFCYIPKMSLPSIYNISMTLLMIVLLYATNLTRTSPFSNLNFKTKSTVMFLFLFMALFVYAIFFSLMREYEDNKLIQKTLDIQKKSDEANIHMYEEMHFLRHEMKNHIFHLNYLLEHKKYDQMKEYFNMIYKQEYSLDTIESGNNLINAILNQKLAYGAANNVPLSIDAALPANLGIDDTHICAVLSNLLDNAIEASRKTDNPAVAISLLVHGNYLYICCKNTVAEDVLTHNRSMASTKKGNYHGVGLQVVKNIVNTYDGVINFRMEDLIFVAEVMLKIPEPQ